MPKRSYGSTIRRRAQCLLEALLDFADNQLEVSERLRRELKVTWLKDGSGLSVVGSLGLLAELTKADKQKGQLNEYEVGTAISYLEEFLGILKRATQQGSSEWRLTLTLWDRNKKKNLQMFAQECQSRESRKSKQHNRLDIDTDTLVQEIRDRVRTSIVERCGTMRVLDMTQPIGLDEIYTSVNILEKITGRRRMEIAELLQGFDPGSEDFHRCGLGRITEKRVPGLDAVERYPKLMVLGKPGAGKTTFLKYLAIQCISGKFQAHQVPIFITLKQFAEDPNSPAMLEFIIQMLVKRGVTDTQTTQLINQGRGFILFDGLDEVREEDSSRVLKQIESFSDQYQTNHFVITCRIAAQEYTFKNFKDVEVSDFDARQIKTFVIKWFRTKENLNPVLPASNEGEGEKAFLYPPMNSGIREDFSVGKKNKKIAKQSRQSKLLNTQRHLLARETDLTSEVEESTAQRFLQQLQSSRQIFELATNPLLLTLLCLEFEDSGDFPSDRAELYKRGIATLLRKWDAKRGIERDQVYKRLSAQRKEDLLSQVAWTTFERKNYFFKQSEVERYIADYICNLPNAQTDSEVLQLDSEAVLKSIEAQHGLLVERASGIYSFSHLTFHEYFTARKIVTSSEPQALEKALQILASHITERRWREVLLLAVGMLPSADRLLQLMKQQVDAFVATDEKLLQFLNWLNQKALSARLPYKLAGVRALYFARYLALDLDLAFYLDGALGSAHGLDLHLDLGGARVHLLELAGNHADVLNLDLTLTRNLVRARALVRGLHYNLAFDCRFELELGQALKELKKQLLDPDSDEKIFKQWWQVNGVAWYRQLKAVMIKYRKMGYDWQFSEQQKEWLKQYYEANKLLMECLSSNSYKNLGVVSPRIVPLRRIEELESLPGFAGVSPAYVSREIREKIENTLLQPIDEISSSIHIAPQLQPTAKTYPITIKAQALEGETDTSAIAQELCNQIYLTASPDELEIPEVSNAPQLKRLIPKIKKQLQKQNLALILDKCEPNQEQVTFCRKLSDVLHIAWITNEPIEPPLKGFLPNQPNLLSAIQSWMDEID
jgi:predicted NACHT family NTPase